jgi:hypothetical protein
LADEVNRDTARRKGGGGGAEYQSNKMEESAREYTDARAEAEYKERLRQAGWEEDDGPRGHSYSPKEVKRKKPADKGREWKLEFFNDDFSPPIERSVAPRTGWKRIIDRIRGF